MKKILFVVFSVSLLTLGAEAVFAQVSIAPTSLFFDDQNRFRSLSVSNGGDEAQEVSISMNFGFPASKDGELFISTDSVLAKEKSIADQIKIFPQNFTLQPQQRQVVRFVMRPKQNTEPGGYWTRVKITSNALSAPIDSAGQDQVGAQINLVINQVIAAHYYTPNAKTGIEVNDVEFMQNTDTNRGILKVSMIQTGNAPFIGSVDFSITSSNGETIWESTSTSSVYTDITRTFDFDLSDIQPGEYQLSGTIQSNRRDVSVDNLLQIDPVSFQKEITIE